MHVYIQRQGKELHWDAEIYSINAEDEGCVGQRFPSPKV